MGMSVSLIPKFVNGRANFFARPFAMVTATRETRSRATMASGLGCTWRPGARQDLLEPERTDDGLHVRNFAIAHPIDELTGGRDKGLEELAFIQHRLPLLEIPCEINVDELGGI